MDEAERYYMNAVRANSLCDEYKLMWRAVADDSLRLLKVGMSRAAIPHMAHFCRTGKGVTKEYMMERFGKYINGWRLFGCDGRDGFSSMLYIGYSKAVTQYAETYHLMWCDGPTVYLRRGKCPHIFLSNGTTANIVCFGNNVPVIHVFDSSKAVIKSADDTCKVKVLKYGAESAVEAPLEINPKVITILRKVNKYGR